jgi:hypothetical protein
MLVVLHAGVCDGQFLLWGETPAEAEVLIAGPPGRNRRSRAASGRGRVPPRSLYDAGAKTLSAALTAAGFERLADTRPTQGVVAWLPTVDHTPAAFSPLIAEPPASRAKLTLVPWAVTTLRLSAEQMVEVLCACVGKQTLAPGVIIGKDLGFWATALRFAGALVARQRVLPGVEAIKGPDPGPPSVGAGTHAYRAGWAPVLTGPDADRLAVLARAMPHSGRALTLEAISPPQAPAVAVLSSFVGGVVDHLVRSAIAPATPAHRRQQRLSTPSTRLTTSFDSLHDQWLDALRSPDGVMWGDAAELARFTAQVRDWQRPIAIATATPFRLCFRLEEPEPDGVDTAEDGREVWYVRYLLQAADDPSLLLPAQDAWRARGPQASLLGFVNLLRVNVNIWPEGRGPPQSSRMVEKQPRASRRVPVIVTQQPTETISTHNCTIWAPILWLWSNTLIAKSLMIALVMIMGQVLLARIRQRALPQHHQLLEGLLFDGANKSLTVCVQSRASWR